MLWASSPARSKSRTSWQSQRLVPWFWKKHPCQWSNMSYVMSMNKVWFLYVLILFQEMDWCRKVFTNKSQFKVDPVLSSATKCRSKRSSATSPMSGISGNSNGVSATSDFSWPWKPTKKRRFRCWAVKFRAFTSGLQSLERSDYISRARMIKQTNLYIAYPTQKNVHETNSTCIRLLEGQWRIVDVFCRLQLSKPLDQVAMPQETEYPASSKASRMIAKSLLRRWAKGLRDFKQELYVIL